MTLEDILKSSYMTLKEKSQSNSLIISSDDIKGNSQSNSLFLSWFRPYVLKFRI